MQVLPTSVGSLTCVPSTRPPPPFGAARQPPPCPQPPSSFCWLTSQASPFLTVSLRGFGLTAVVAQVGIGASDLGGSDLAVFGSSARSPTNKTRLARLAPTRATRALTFRLMASSLAKSGCVRPGRSPARRASSLPGDGKSRGHKFVTAATSPAAESLPLTRRTRDELGFVTVRSDQGTGIRDVIGDQGSASDHRSLITDP